MTASARPASEPALLRLENVTRVFGPVRAVEDVSLDVFPGEFLTLLGASGSGKTTLLRTIAGFESPDSGRIWLGGTDVTDLPPYVRPVNMMFQSYALFPHMTVEENIAFGLKQDGMAKGERQARVDEMLELVRLSPLARRKPHQLSGGQSQRVALARSLAKHPKLLLLDEPLAALDRQMRERTQFELMALQKRVGITFVVVTHDQEEAMTMSSRIAVMDNGRIVQVGTPREIYEAPGSRFIAQFVGAANLIEGRIAGARDGVALVHTEGTAQEIVVPSSAPPAPGTAVAVAVRPQRLALGNGAASDNQISGTVSEFAYVGGATICHVTLGNGAVMRVRLTEGAGGPIPAPGQSVILSWPPSGGVLLVR